MKCEHKTEEELKVCNDCHALVSIARTAKKLLAAQTQMLTALLVPDVVDAKRLDELQDEVQSYIKQLKQDVDHVEKRGLLQ